MVLEKHELTHKQKDDRLIFFKGIYCSMTLAKQFLLIKQYLYFEKLSKEN